MEKRRKYELERKNTQLLSKRQHISIPEFNKAIHFESGREFDFESNPEKVQSSPSHPRQADWKKERQQMFECEPAFHMPRPKKSGKVVLEKTLSIGGSSISRKREELNLSLIHI
eukprot:TRINITY_DN51114_c0_g1_i1.p3 TRINITY_DN51114_c0_g1~~TRINITY_DN51114_c0_g1_i1.p3  ORF type:complete len:125 (-),score=23.85 TRINITY_DN51114_c0_g1_i1:79-420(-)